MPINFQALFQDTWNFVRNRPNFTLYAVVLLAVLQVAISSFIPRPELTPAIENSSIRAQINGTEMLMSSVFSMLVIVLVNVLVILNIKSINNGNYQTFLNNMPLALSKFIPTVLITLVQVLPISFGLAFALMPSFGDAASLMALPMMLMGLFVFIKLNLAIYAYLIDDPQKGIGETLKYTWGFSRGRMMPLIMFTAIIYFIPTVLGAVAGALSALGTIGVIMGQAFNAFINLLIVIFSFRFYQTYRQ